MFIYYGFDWAYLILVLPCVLFAMYASYSVNSAFKNYSQYETHIGISGADAARRVLAAHGIRHVQVVCIDGNLSDHFDPKSNIIRLSYSVYHGRNVAAVGVACHEAGHAVQYATAYAPLRLRTAIIPITNIGSKLALPLFLIGLLFAMPVICYAGIAFFALAAVFQAVTLPVEYNASNRALKAMEDSRRFNEEELKASKKVLGAAALTYVAALATSLAQILRLLVIAGGSRNRRD